MTGVMIYLPGPDSVPIHIYVSETTAEQFAERRKRGDFENLQLDRPTVRIVLGAAFSGKFHPETVLQEVQSGAGIPQSNNEGETDATILPVVPNPSEATANLPAQDLGGGEVDRPVAGGEGDGGDVGAGLDVAGREAVPAANAAPAGDAGGKSDGGPGSGAGGGKRGRKATG